MAYTTIEPTTAPTISTPLQTPSSKSAFETQLQAALEHARRLTEMHGTESIEVALAWETVEELQTAKASHQKVNPTIAFVRYCAENPDASEARVYDV
ncbi:cp12 domain protein [Leptolyngbya sp. Heron Island J]|uniref:Calvin cycle protein CP12 n=1 Tax=Leptolyngbya sp. Heron Island J TaxID=1385935 RepID=UPI0003B9B77F|nr:Calvin cycle protein CP12 [Leptolyngbya sp. Heron Island J]ESA38352.1 cp12 domain protein [Leptolyngbya sp. Heron Island J]